MILVADIGGTNSRLAVAEATGPDAGTIRSFRNSEFGCFDDLLELYLSDLGIGRPRQMVIAVAGPVHGNAARLTNLHWELVGEKLAHSFQSDRVEIINDLTALGYAIANLGQEHLGVLVEGTSVSDHGGQALVVGIGTGFNVSPVIQCRDQVICPSVEAGHASMPTQVTREMDHRVKGLSDLFPTIEHCFSGRGLQQFFNHVIGDNDKDAASLVASYAQAGAERVTEAIDLYAELLGHLLRDLSLYYRPTGGIFLAGGVARSVLSTPAAQRCAMVLRQPSQFHAGQIPAWVIVEDTVALIGCTQFATHPID